MKTYKSPIYGNCPEPESFLELTELINVLDIEDPVNPFVHVKLWRGQANIDWTVDSSGIRRVNRGCKILKDDNRELRSYEKHLLEHATHKGFRYQEGRVISDMELLAKLQHHGAATRLVDFSRNALIALWFSLFELPQKTGLLIGVHSDYVGGTESSLRDMSYDKTMDSCEKFKHSIVYEPPVVSPRIAAQHAQFLYSAISTEQTGSLMLPQEDESRVFIAISPQMKKLFFQILRSTYDYQAKTLFPDLDGFGMANKFNTNPDMMDRW